jgi:hypothetical protein
MRPIALFLLLACSSAAQATAQIADELVLHGRSEMLFTNPLDSAPGALAYFAKHGGDCTALWRGYVASWEIRAGELYLTKVIVDACSAERKREIALSDLFPGAKGPVKAGWYSGRLRVPRGRMVEHLHMGYGSRFESYLEIDIVAGKVTRVEPSR